MEFFRLQSQTLSSLVDFLPQRDVFPGKGGIVVDVTAASNTRAEIERRGVVCVGRHQFYKLKGRTESWAEIFTWRLSEFAEDGKIGHWEIWGDHLTTFAVSETRAYV